MNNQIVISRIQNRRGIRENLPQPLLPGEFALTVDTGELWIGTDPNQPPFGVRTYGSGAGDIASAENIVDNQIASAKFTTLDETGFNSLVTYLTGTPTPAVDLTSTDILWDERETVFIAADTSVDVANTIDNVLDAVLNSPVSASFDSANSGALGALNNPNITSSATSLEFVDSNPDTILYDAGASDFVSDGFFAGQKIVVSGSASNDGTFTIDSLIAATITLDAGDSLTAETVGATLQGRANPALTDAFDPIDGDFLFTISGSNAEQGANAATLINQIHGSQLVTTLANLQVTTTGIGVGSSTFRDWEVFDREASLPFTPTWSDTGTASADSVTDKMHVVSGEGINVDVDTTNDALRITNTFADVPENQFSLAASTAVFTDIGLDFDMEADSDVIFIDYSLNIDGATASTENYTAGGQMIVVGNVNVGTGDATLTDTQVEVRDAGLVGVVSFQAVYSAGTGPGGNDEIKIQYTNTFTEIVEFRVVRKRWLSF